MVVLYGKIGNTRSIVIPLAQLVSKVRRNILRQAAVEGIIRDIPNSTRLDKQCPLGLSLFSHYAYFHTTQSVCGHQAAF